MKHRVPHIDARLSLKRPDAGQHLVKQNACRKNIGARIDAFAAGLLRRSIGRCAIRNSNFGEIRVMDSRRAHAFINQFRQTEIEDLDLA